MIIDTTYFQKQPLFVPNTRLVPSLGDNVPSNISELESAIENLEYQLLLSCLGIEQYTELKEQFETNGDLKPDALEKWKSLVNGKGLENGRYWKGLRYTVGTNKNSLIANYVFYNFLLNDEYPYSTTGLQRPNSENSTDVNGVSKLVREWNKFVFYYQGNNFEYCLCNNIVKTTELSLYEFMLSFPDDYDMTFFKLYPLQNIWGI